MQTSTTRAIENISKGFKSFSRPSADAINALALEKLSSFPVSVVEAGPSKKNGKFCKKHWTLTIHWKLGAPVEEFPSEEIAKAAQEAYQIQNAKGIQCRTSLLLDQLREQAREELWRDYESKVCAQAGNLAKVTRADARKDLSRMR
jgi:hypothetical protein